MNKNVFLSILITLSTSIGCSAQQIQVREVKPFHKIEVSGSVNVFYTHSDTMSLSVKADKDEFDRIETRVENSTLIITHKGKFSDPVTVYLKNNHLNALEVSGASDFKMMNTLKTDSIELNASGSSNIVLTLQAPKVKCVQSGASDVVLNGSADYLEANIASASTLKGYNLNVKNADVVTTGAATAKIYVTDKLTANASGASDIKIKGEPRDVSAESTTASSITKIKEVSKGNGRTQNDTTVYNWKHKKVLIVRGIDMSPNDDNWTADESSFKHWRGFALGINGYMNGSGGLSISKPHQYMEVDYAHSFNLQFNIIERQFNLSKNYVKLITGFGFDYHSYALTNKTTLDADSSFTWGVIDSTANYSYKKNRFRSTYLQVPLLLEFNTSDDPNKAYHIAFGVIGQYLVSSRTKQILGGDGAEFTRERRDSYNLSPFALKAHVSIGYRGFNIFGEYGLSPMFQSGKGPDLAPFGIGVRWSFS